jgi:hypothetical protein
MCPVDVLGLVTLLVVGFTACAEVGSYAFVHPVIRRLPPDQMLTVEQGLLGTFGRAFPVLMPLGGLALIGYAWLGGVAGVGGADGPTIWRWLAVAAWAAATVTTLVVNVPINTATATWDPASPPAGWQALRRRWDVFQAVRAWLLLLAFGSLAVSLTTR